MSVPQADSAVQTRESYEAEVRANFKWNGPLGIVQGLLLYVQSGLLDQGVVIPNFLYALTGSNTFVGLASTIGMFANSVPQLFGASAVEHLPVKKYAMLKFGWLSCCCWVLIAIATVILPTNLILYLFLPVQALASAFMGLYLLVWQDVMSKVIPVESRGNYFGLRNFLATMATAAGVTAAGYLLKIFRFPLSYSLTFAVGFVFYALALLTLAQTREPAAWRTMARESPWQKFKKVPTIFKEDTNFFRFCLIRSIGAGFCTMASPFYILYARQRLAGADIGMLVGYLGTTAAVSRAVSNLLWGAVAQKFGYKMPLQLSFSIFALAAVTAVFSSSIPMFIVVYIINGLANAGMMMSTMNILMEFGQIQTRTTYIGISSVISGMIGGFAPLVGGLLSDVLSYRALFLITASISVVSTLAMVRFVTDPRYVAAYKE